MSAKQGWGIAFVVLGLLGVFVVVYRNLIEPGFVDEFTVSEMMLDIVLNPLAWLGFVGLWMVVSEQDKSTQKVQPKNYLMKDLVDRESQTQKVQPKNYLMKDLVDRESETQKKRKAAELKDEIHASEDLELPESDVSPAERPIDETLTHLERLSSLLAADAITHDEYETLKRKLLESN